MKILSRINLLELVRAEPKQHKVVVIHEIGKFNEVAEIVELCRETIVLEMDDVIFGRPGAPTKEKVEAGIKSGFEIVACKFGISRSSAIAYLLESQRTSPQEAIAILDVNKHYPNQLILKFGIEILGIFDKNPIIDFYKRTGLELHPHSLLLVK